MNSNGLNYKRLCKLIFSLENSYKIMCLSVVKIGNILRRRKEVKKFNRLNNILKNEKLKLYQINSMKQ